VEDPETATDWECTTSALADGETGALSILEISVHDDGIPPAARIGFDDLGLMLGLFSDGFESGDTSAWSSVVSPVSTVN
jgi:hypothetical protein